MIEQSLHTKHGRSKRKFWLLVVPFSLLLLILFRAHLSRGFNSNQDLRKLGLDNQVGPITFSPDGRMLVAGEGHATAQVRVWDLQTGQTLHTIKTGHDHGVGLLAISPDGKLLVTCSIEDDMRLLLWDMQTGRKVSQFLIKLSFTHSLFFSRDGTLLVAAGYSRLGNNTGSIEIWDWRKGQLLHTMPEPKGDVFAVPMPDGKMLLTASSDGLKLRDLRNGRLVQVLSGGRGKECVQAVLSPSSQTLALGTRATQGQAESIELWDMQSARMRLTSLENQGAPWGRALKSLAFSPESKLLASSSVNPQTGEGEIRVRDAQSGKVLHTLKYSSSAVAFSPDSKTLAIGTQREVQLWKVDALLKRVTP